MKNKKSIKNVFRGFLDNLKRNETMRLALILVIVAVIMAIIDAGVFYSGSNLINMAKQIPEYSLMAFGIMLAMINGGIDLSVVGIANLTAVVVGKLLIAGTSDSTSTGTFILLFIGCLVVALLIGLACGWLNGFLVSQFGIPPMLVTMGSMQLFQGICMVLTEGTAVTGIPKLYRSIVAYDLFGIIPVYFIVFILCVIGIWILLEKTPLGVQIYMMGTNPNATKMAGIRNQLNTEIIFMISGFLSSLAGLIMLARMNSARADFGESYNTQALLIVILGCTSPRGGYANIKAMLLAIVIMQFVSSGMSMIPSVSSYIKTLTWGVILVAMIVINWYIEKHKTVKAA